ncbi:MAG: hypothetical protein WBA73_13980 [Devosia sp.]
MSTVQKVKADPTFRPVRREPLVFPSYEASGLKIRKSLRLLCADRKARGVPLGAARDWIRAASYATALLADETGNVASIAGVEACLAHIGFPCDDVPRIDVVWTAWEVAAANREGLVTSSARYLGDLVKITRDERDRTGIRCLDAIDEPAEERRRRLKAASAQRARAKLGAKPRSRSDAQTKPWLSLGISQRKWERWTPEERVAAIRGAVTLIEGSEVHETPPLTGNVHVTPPIDGGSDAA